MTESVDISALELLAKIMAGEKTQTPGVLVGGNAKGSPTDGSIDSHGLPNNHRLALAAAHILHQAQSATTLNDSKTSAETLQTLASIVNSSAANKGLLPNSAPVSSLLPHIHASNSAHSSISSQIASLISQTSNPAVPAVTPTPAVVARPPNTSAHVPATAHPTHLLHQTSASQVTGSVALPNIQKWPLVQLQQQVNLLEQLGQPVPQTVSLLHADARRKEDKRNAKRIANRKSASTSRARKKAYVQEMTELNARLKRQALILSLLPDMVIVIGVEGEITFCSAQVGRVLRYDTEELIGGNLSKVLVPASRNKLNRLVKQLLGNVKTEESRRKSEERQERKEAARLPAAVSEPSFPPSVVKVQAKIATCPNNNGASDDQNSGTSTSIPGKQISSLTATNSNFAAQSANAEYLEPGTAVKEGSGPEDTTGRNPSSDLSNSSSLSTNAKNVQQANQNLVRNVRWHNKKMKAEKSSFRDDVTGADVTANNASARLSSLQHRLESYSSDEDDSGYRESNDSREESSSSVSDSSGSNGKS